MGINNDFSMRAASTSVTAPPTNVTGYTISPSNDAKYLNKRNMVFYADGI